MNSWQKVLKFIGEWLPVAAELLDFITEIPDKEWEEISKVWPSPTKTKLARMRAEAKAMKHFFGED